MNGTAEPTVRTVSGDVSPAALGLCDAHDHLFLRSPQLPGQELDDTSAAAAELRAFREAGGGTVVQWTPYGMGRRAGELPRLAEESGVRIVAATGLHQAVHYAAGVLERVAGRGGVSWGVGGSAGSGGSGRSGGSASGGAESASGGAGSASGGAGSADLAGLFVAELTTGIGSWGGGFGADGADGAAARPRAGMIKVAGGFHGLDAHAAHTMAAAAEAHHATGAPIGVHLELGTGAPDVLDLLCGKLEVPPERVILGHLNRSPDPVAHRTAAAAGAYLAFDGPSRAHHATDWRLPDALAALADAGYGDRLLLGGDTTTAAGRSVDGGPGMPHLLRRLRPRLEQTLGEALVRRIFTTNPARAFAVAWEPVAGGS
ncbi:phosphotriesterase [Streptomyces sp. CB02923]|uniref:phosphotriesterase family protein n=1 Tax=Streptomyces sp. CB02923 TaxID=1718985 RepID=UPI00093EF272|nr:phosphotriesterase [Streptomyces sp. CB02923]OKH98570.1 phosphotriesterase [Streptomyces sp. CB02923]